MGGATMKYLLLDTNIYIDMIVSRRRSHNADSYELLKMLLKYDKVKIILPAIIETEIKRNVTNEIQKIGKLIREAKGSINHIYWINHVEEIKKFNDQISLLNKTLGLMINEFDKNQEKFISDAYEKISDLMQHENMIRIEENNDLLLNVQKRKLYKQCPFHIKDKESWADAMIIETLININEFIDIKDEDQIYFITTNITDFSKGKQKQDKDIIHPHIEKNLDEKGLLEQFNYRIHYTKTLLEDFSEETQEARIYQSLLEQVEEENKAMIDNWHQEQLNVERELSGLSSLSSDDYFIEKISESDKVRELITETNDSLSSLELEIESVLEEYRVFVDVLNEKPANHLVPKIQTYNNQSPFLQIVYESGFNEDEVRDNVLEFVHENLCSLKNLEDSLDSIICNDFFDIDDLLKFMDLEGNTYVLSAEGHLQPRDGEEDSIFIVLRKNGENISYGGIKVTYGYINFNDDGNVSDGLAQSITYEIGHVSKAFTDVVNNTKECIKKIRGDLAVLRNILGI